MRDGGYPLGAEYDKRAPYNQDEMEPREIEVDVFVTLSLRTKIKVDDYDVYEDWDDDEGKILVTDFDNCNLTKQAMEQISLPNETEEFKEWTLDDFQVYQA